MGLFNETNASPLNKQGNFRMPYAVLSIPNVHTDLFSKKEKEKKSSHEPLLICLRIQGWFKGILQPPNC